MLILDNLDAYILVKKYKLMLLYIIGLVILKLFYMLLLMTLLVKFLLHILTLKKL